MLEQSGKLRVRAHQARRENRPNDARQDLIEAVALCRQEGKGIDLARALADLGQMERDLHCNAAPKNYEEAVAIYRAAGDVLDWAHTVRHVGDILSNMGRKELAGPCFRTALGLYRGDARTAPLDLANTLRGYALPTDDNGESVRAKPLWQEARDLYAAVGADEGVKESSHRLPLWSINE